MLFQQCSIFQPLTDCHYALNYAQVLYMVITTNHIQSINLRLHIGGCVEPVYLNMAALDSDQECMAVCEPTTD